MCIRDSHSVVAAIVDNIGTAGSNQIFVKAAEKIVPPFIKEIKQVVVSVFKRNQVKHKKASVQLYENLF